MAVARGCEGIISMRPQHAPLIQHVPMNPLGNNFRPIQTMGALIPNACGCLGVPRPMASGVTDGGMVVPQMQVMNEFPQMHFTAKPSVSPLVASARCPRPPKNPPPDH
eukprot:4355307-Pyramimonas_sp.AAC.1